MQRDAQQIIDEILPTETENCRPLLTKFLCAELVSPCFPDAREPAIYLPCNTTCYQMSEKCPTFFSHYTKYFHVCEEHPPGNGEKGFCKIKRWDQLLDIFFIHKKGWQPWRRGGRGGGGRDISNSCSARKHVLLLRLKYICKV